MPACAHKHGQQQSAVPPQAKQALQFEIKIQTFLTKTKEYKKE